MADVQAGQNVPAAALEENSGPGVRAEGQTHGLLQSALELGRPVRACQGSRPQRTFCHMLSSFELRFER